MALNVAVIIWSAILTPLICYAWWSSIRVWALRQDLSAIRDQAWAIMESKGMLDNVHHRELQKGIDAIIRSASDVTVFTAETMVVIDLSTAEECDTPVPAEIEAFAEQACERLAHYLLFESIGGWAFVWAAPLVRMFPHPSRPLHNGPQTARRFNAA